MSANKSLLLKTRHYRWYPPENHLGYAEEVNTCDPASTILMLVDVYLPDQFDPQKPVEEQYSRLSRKDYRLWRGIIEDSVAPLILAARNAKIPVLYVCNKNDGVPMQGSAFAKKIEKSLGFRVEDAFNEIVLDSQKSAGKADSQLNFLDSVAPQQGDYFIGKTVYSGFFNTPLDTLLRNLGIKTVICAGFRLDACLMGTVLDGLYRGYDFILVRDATLACELPHEIDEQKFTQRMVLHFEALIGSSTTQAEFVNACRVLFE